MNVYKLKKYNEESKLKRVTQVLYNFPIILKIEVP